MRARREERTRLSFFGFAPVHGSFWFWDIFISARQESPLRLLPSPPPRTCFARRVRHSPAASEQTAGRRSQRRGGRGREAGFRGGAMCPREERVVNSRCRQARDE